MSPGLHHVVPGGFALAVNRHLAQDRGQGALRGADADVLGFAFRHPRNERLQGVDRDIVPRFFGDRPRACVVGPVFAGGFSSFYPALPSPDGYGGPPSFIYLLHTTRDPFKVCRTPSAPSPYPPRIDTAPPTGRLVRRRCGRRRTSLSARTRRTPRSSSA